MNDDVNEIFIADVERIRKLRGWSTVELAKRAQLDLAELETVLTGKDPLALDVIILLAKGLGVPPGALIDGTAEITNEVD